MERIARKPAAAGATLALAVTVALALAACQPLEKTARDTIASEQGFLDKAVENHASECQTAPAKALCVAIKKAGLARNVAIDALELYCSGSPRRPGQPAFADGGACAPDKSLEPKLKAALVDLKRDIGDVKTLAGGTP